MKGCLLVLLLLLIFACCCLPSACSYSAMQTARQHREDRLIEQYRQWRYMRQVQYQRIQEF